MLPKRVIFAANARLASGAGHIRRLIEVANALPASIERHFFGSIEIPWLQTFSRERFLPTLPYSDYGVNDLVILDSYEEDFCAQTALSFRSSKIIQISDRHTFLLPTSKILFMDLPFQYVSADIGRRVIAHGVEYLPIRQFRKNGLNIGAKAKRVLITTGGVVNDSIFEQLMNELTKNIYKSIRFEFIGRPFKGSRIVDNFTFHPLGAGFDFVAGECDTAISAAGTTMWDLLANNFIIGLAAIAENQRTNFEFALHSNQALPVFSSDELELNQDNLRALFFDENVRQALYRRIIGQYDFLGAARSSKAILESFKYD